MVRLHADSGSHKDETIFFLIFIVVPCILVTSQFFLPTNSPFIKDTKC